MSRERKRARSPLFWHVLLIAYIGLIFFHSLMPASQSSAESGFVLELIRGGLSRLGLDGGWLTEHMVRKFAHFSEYAGMGVLLSQSMRAAERGTRVYRLHPYAVFFVPFTDETIQLFVEGRSGQISDVWLDMSGAAAGLLISALVYACLAARAKRGPASGGSGAAKEKENGA